jgi:hypothetical protein
MTRLSALVFACVASAFLIGTTAAQTPDQVDWLLVATSKDMVVFFDNRGDRIERNTFDATVFTFHVLAEPKPAQGGKIAWFLRRTKYDCVKPQMSQQLVIGFDENGEGVFTDDKEKPMVPFKLGTVTADISVMACDGFSPNGDLQRFTSRAAAIAHAKKQMATAKP